MRYSSVEVKKEGYRVIFLSHIFRESRTLDDGDRKSAVKFIEKQVTLPPQAVIHSKHGLK